MTKKNAAPTFATILSLGFVIIIDSLVLGIVFPLMGGLFLNPEHAIVPASTSVLARDIYYSLAMGSFFIFAIIGAPFLGDLSDKIGRRKVLLISLLGGGLSCVLAAAAIEMKIAWLLIVARSAAGLMAGNQPLAQAAIIDVSTPETKARNISLITLATTSGFALGPLIGGLFSDNRLFAFSSYSTPFLIAALLALLNAAILLFSFHETFYPPESEKKLDLIKGFSLLIDGFKHSRLKKWVWICLLGQLAWGIYFQSISLVLIQRYFYSTTQISFFMTYIAVLFVLSLTFLTPILLKKYSLISLILMGFCVTSVSLIIAALTLKFVLAQWLILIPFTIGETFVYTITITLISNAVDNNSQGWAMGVSSAVGSFSWGIGAFLAGGLVNVNTYLPFIIPALLFASCFLFIKRYSPKAEKI